MSQFKKSVYGGFFDQFLCESRTCVSHSVFLLQSLKPAAEDFVKRMPCRKVDPITQGNGLVMAAVFVVPLLCVLGKQNGSSTCFQMFFSTCHCWLQGSSQAAARRVSSDHSDCNSPPKWENNTKTIIGKDKSEIA